MTLKVALAFAAAAALLASPAAGGYPYPGPVYSAQQSNILRTPGNLGQISTYSKAIDTPYSSVRKSDVRVSNDALAYPGGFGVALHGSRPPVYGPAAAAVPGRGLLGVAYSAAPAVAHMSFEGPSVSYAY